MRWEDRASTSEGPTSFWADALSHGVVRGADIDAEAGLRILRTPDADLPPLLWAAFRVREHYHGRRVKLCVLRNARSGMCGEDCSYCSQSKVSEAPITTYRLDSVEELLAAARQAVGAGARRFCMVTSGRGPTRNDVERFTAAARVIKQEFPHLELCVSLGIMDVNQANAEDMTRQLAAQEGIFAGISSGGAVAAALRLSAEVENAVIVVVICDRGDRYLSTGVFPD